MQLWEAGVQLPCSVQVLCTTPPTMEARNQPTLVLRRMLPTHPARHQYTLRRGMQTRKPGPALRSPESSRIGRAGTFSSSSCSLPTALALSLHPATDFTTAIPGGTCNHLLAIPLSTHDSRLCVHDVVVRA